MSSATPAISAARRICSSLAPSVPKAMFSLTVAEKRKGSCEITAICEYLEEKKPEPALTGRTPEERAATRMWVRRIDLNIVEPMANGFRFAEGLGLFKNRIRTIPHAADDLKAIAREKLEWLDGVMRGPWIVGDRFTLADVLLFAFAEFGASVRQGIDPKLLKLTDWYARVAARESVAKSK